MKSQEQRIEDAARALHDIRFGGHPYDYERCAREILEAADKEPAPKFKKGDHVRVTRTPWAGCAGTIMCCDSPGRQRPYEVRLLGMRPPERRNFGEHELELIPDVSPDNVYSTGKWMAGPSALRLGEANIPIETPEYPKVFEWPAHQSKMEYWGRAQSRPGAGSISENVEAILRADPVIQAAIVWFKDHGKGDSLLRASVLHTNLARVIRDAGLI